MDIDDIHALIIGDPAVPKVISISHQFCLTFDAEARVIKIVDKGERPLLFEHRVKSLHALYGENGSGKTELLLQIASTFAKTQKAARIGVLYSQGGRLCLYKGQPLGGRWSVSDDSLDIRLVKSPPRASAIFYTTSPFEARRRSGLSHGEVLDVSPTFGKGLSLDGFALLDSFPHVQDKAPFLEKLRLSVKAKLPSEDLMIQRIMTLFSETQFPGIAAKTVRLQLRTWLSELAPKLAEVTLLNLQLIMSVPINTARTTDIPLYFAQRLANLIARISERPEYEGLGEEFAKVCQDYTSDFPKVFAHTGDELWHYLRITGGILKNKPTVEIYMAPADIIRMLPTHSENDRSIALKLVELGLLQFKLKNLSSGETALLLLYASMASALSTLEKAPQLKPVILLLDEGEMFLHPSWQRKYINNVLDFVAKFPKVAARIHVFLSTHSLIVAADAPPNTLFDVSAGETRNGFGLGPGAMLSDVYHVERFAGTNTGALIDKLVTFLKNPAQKNTDTIRDLAASLADVDLQRYVQQELVRRAGV